MLSRQKLLLISVGLGCLQEVWSGRVLPAPEWRGGLLSCGLYRILYVPSGGGSLLCWRYFDFLFLYIMFPRL